jgi:hypothetical protein
MSQGLEEIGITGYPESHPFIGDDTTIHAMFDKAPLRRTVRTTPPMAPHVGRAAGALSRVPGRGPSTRGVGRGTRGTPAVVARVVGGMVVRVPSNSTQGVLAHCRQRPKGGQ